MKYFGYIVCTLYRANFGLVARRTIELRNANCYYLHLVRYTNNPDVLLELTLCDKSINITKFSI
jgi:hypothetical protein